MSTIDKRISELEQFRARQEHRKNRPVDDVERIRQHLESVDGQHDLDRRPGENLWDELVRRLQVADGWNLALMPGATLEDKLQTVDDAANNENFVVSAETRGAARHYIALYQGI